MNLLFNDIPLDGVGTHCLSEKPNSTKNISQNIKIHFHFSL